MREFGAAEGRVNEPISPAGSRTSSCVTYPNVVFHCTLVLQLNSSEYSRHLRQSHFGKFEPCESFHGGM